MLPRIPERLFRWYCDPLLEEQILGDLQEQFESDAETFGLSKARWRFTWNVIRFFRPGIIRKFEGSTKLNYYGMFKHNLKISWRNLMKQKSFFAINICGLAIGVATCLVISLFILDELSYDRFNHNADHIARVVLKGQVQGESINEAITPAAAAAAFQEEIPEVGIGTRLKATEMPLVSNGKQNFRESRFAYVDPNFFSVFSIQFLKGDPKTALTKTDAILITESEAEKYFGDEDPMGSTLEFKDWGKRYEVMGVIEDIPDNSHFHFDLFGSMLGYENASKSDWLNSDFHSYVLLNEGAAFEEVEAKIPVLLEKYMGPQLQEAFGISMTQFEESGNSIRLYLQPLVDIHLHSNFSSQSELEAGGNITTLYIFGIIALFALLVSCINFINLSTAAASRRMKEVGLKRVVGSSKNQLMLQFLSESLLTTLAAMLLAALLIWFSLPVFNAISGKMFQFSDFVRPNIIAIYFGFGVVISLLAGTYPALVLSSLQPLAALNQKASINGKVSLRGGLVVFQFVISTVLIIGTLIVNQQMNFIQEKDIGYDKEGLIVISNTALLGKGGQSLFKEKLTANASVENLTISNHLPAGPTNSSMDNVFLEEGSNDFRRSSVYLVDEEYIPTMGMDLLAGRNFSAASEANYVIINETFASTFGLGDDPIGKTISTDANQQGAKFTSTIIGVVKDFHFRPLHKEIEPLIMRKREGSGIIVRTKMANMPRLLSDIDIIWNEFNVDEPLHYALLDDLYQRTYVNEQNIGTLFKIFAALTIFIATLGLFGLVTFTIDRKTKEIGIRKVLGSTVGGVVSMLSIEFLKLIGIALIIACPIGYFAMSTWLDDFAYRIDINWWVFAIAGAITGLVSGSTVAAKSLTAALVNPAEILKDE